MNISPATGMSSKDIRGDYMMLLVAQLQHQNPLEPMSNDQMASQMAQLAQLEQLEHMNSTFDEVLVAEQAQISQLQQQVEQLDQLSGLSPALDSMLLAEKISQASGLIGKNVSFEPEVDENGEPFEAGEDPEAVIGTVDSIELDGATITLTVGNYKVDLDDIKSITN